MITHDIKITLNMYLFSYLSKNMNFSGTNIEISVERMRFLSTIYIPNQILLIWSMVLY
jgi:hypothetical protein